MVAIAATPTAWNRLNQSPMAPMVSFHDRFMFFNCTECSFRMPFRDLIFSPWATYSHLSLFIHQKLHLGTYAFDIVIDLLAIDIQVNLPGVFSGHQVLSLRCLTSEVWRILLPYLYHRQVVCHKHPARLIFLFYLDLQPVETQVDTLMCTIHGSGYN